MRFFHPSVRLTNQKRNHARLYPFDKPIKSLYFCSFFVFSFVGAFSFQGHTKIAPTTCSSSVPLLFILYQIALGIGTKSYPVSVIIAEATPFSLLKQFAYNTVLFSCPLFVSVSERYVSRLVEFILLVPLQRHFGLVTWRGLLNPENERR